MNRIAIFCLLAIGCSRGPTTVRGPRVVMADSSGQSQLTLQQGALVGVPAPNNKTMFLDTSGALTLMDSTGARTPVGGAGAGFSSDVKVIIPVDGGAPVTASEWITTLDAGTSQVNIQSQSGGSPIPHYIGSSNLAGAQSVTTSTATPTEAWNTGSDSLIIKLGTAATKLLVTGLDCDTDGGYEIDFVGTVTAVVEMNLKLNDSDDTGTVEGNFSSTGNTATVFQVNHLIMADGATGTVASQMRLRCFPGAHKLWHMSEYDGVHQEWYDGYSTVTANVTSFSVNNLATGTLGVRRIRPTAK